ncbi:hypothetical protein ACOMHN_051590 [Nucella lapillus]
MEDPGVQEIAEGKAKVLLPRSVFYNPVQEFNRDLTTCVIAHFAQQFLAEQASDPGRRRRGRQPRKTDSDSAGEGTHSGVKDSEMKTDGDSAGEGTHCGVKDSERKTDSDSAGEGTHCGVKDSERKADGDSAGESSHSGAKDGEDSCADSQGIRIFEGLAASGLRSIRFGLEIPHVKEVIANDFDKGAVEFIEKNIERNGLRGRVKSSCGDASMVMYRHKAADERFDVIDLDPYGSAAPFLDAAVQAVGEGGLLCVTCTDTAVLCGNAGETCFAKYGALSLRTKFCHEMALRVLLHCLQAQAGRYGRYIEPLLSLSIDFYVRVFVRVFTGQRRVKMAVTRTSMLHHCVGCGSFALQPLALATPTKGDDHKFAAPWGPPVGRLCEHCGHRHQTGGPLWSAPLHHAGFVEGVLGRLEKEGGGFGTAARMRGMLSVVREELQDVPLYYVLDHLCNTLHCTPPNMLHFRSALINAGYRVSLSHAAKNSYKTDAPPAVIWDILRAWVQQHPVSERRLTEGSVARAILSKPPGRTVSFTPHPQANPASRQQGLVRWQVNPQPHWGPRPRARRLPATHSASGGRQEGGAEGEEDGDMAGEEDGDMAGEEDGDMAEGEEDGDMAGEEDGDMAEGEEDGDMAGEEDGGREAPCDRGVGDGTGQGKGSASRGGQKAGDVAGGEEDGDMAEGAEDGGREAPCDGGAGDGAGQGKGGRRQDGDDSVTGLKRSCDEVRTSPVSYCPVEKANERT